MPARQSEAIVLRTYPFREADLIVSFFSRDQGKIRGIAKRARRPRSPFGSGLERLAHVRMGYFQRESRDLVQLDAAELLGPPVFLRAGYAGSVGLDFVAEVSGKMLPEAEPNDTFFRLLVMVLGEFWAAAGRGRSGPAGALTPRTSGGEPAANGAPASVTAAAGEPDECGDLWRTLSYFALWAVRLGGWLPALDVCAESGEPIGPEQNAYYERMRDGVFSARFKTQNSWPLPPEARRLAAQMLRNPLPALRSSPWRPEAGEPLRRFLTQRLENHLESKLHSAAVLAEL